MAFDELKILLISVFILVYWNLDRKTVIEANFSEYAVERSLFQINNEWILQSVAFFSKKNLFAEINYFIYDKELLAIIRCMKQWNAEFRNVVSFTILTDYKNLEYFIQKRRLSE